MWMYQIKVLLPSILQAISHQTLCTEIPVQHLDFNLEQCLPDNFTQPFADNNYPSDQQQARPLFGSQMNHSFPETNKMMNAPNAEINRHLNFMPQQLSEQQFPQRPHNSERTNHQVIMNAFSLPKISLDHFSGDPLMWHQWYSFFKSTIHENPALSTVQKVENSVTHKAKDSICGYS